MENSNTFLHKRADGFVETADGQIAVTMRVKTGFTDGVNHFTYSPGHNQEAITVEWNATDKLAIFPVHIAGALLSRRYAVQPDPAAIAWANDAFAPVAPVLDPPIEPVLDLPIAPTILDPIPLKKSRITVNDATSSSQATDETPTPT